MLRRTAIKRKPRHEPQAEKEPRPMAKPLAKAPNYGGTTSGVAVAKTKPMRNRALLDMAKGRPCLIGIPLLCDDERETVVAAHSNKSEHGKAAGRKADDQYSVWACWKCHYFIDQGIAPQRMKDGFWQIAHLAQVLEWRRIATDQSEPERFRKAAQWALDALNATPVGGIE